MNPAAAVAVIDTNVWLDLFVFLDPGAAPLRLALQEPACLRAVRSRRTDAEIEAVVQRPPFCELSARAADGIAQWCRMAGLVEPCGPAPWNCRDPDDQKFLELAFAAGASLLLTKDKALLALDRATRGAGLRVLTPSAYAQAGDREAQRQRIVQGVVAP